MVLYIYKVTYLLLYFLGILCSYPMPTEFTKVATGCSYLAMRVRVSTLYVQSHSARFLSEFKGWGRACFGSKSTLYRVCTCLARISQFSSHLCHLHGETRCHVWEIISLISLKLCAEVSVCILNWCHGTGGGTLPSVLSIHTISQTSLKLLSGNGEVQRETVNSTVI